jgi:Protein of unknown function (DUF1761)
MPDVNLLAVLVAGVLSLVIGAVYYGALMPAGDAAERPAPWMPVAELARGLVLSAVIAGLAVQGGIDTLAGGLALGVALFAGFPLVLWTGAMLHERTPLKTAVLHAGDWLAKLLALSVLLSLWQ